MKKNNIFIKLLATILTITIIIGLFPATVFAEEINESQLMKNTEFETLEQEKSPIVGEITEKRDETTKVFERQDGTFTAVVTSDPIHYEENGEWIEIDNTLSQSNGIITNKNNSFSVELPTEMNDGETVSLTDGDSILNFSINDIEQSNAIINNLTENSVPEILDTVKTTTSVEYKSVMSDTDIKYDVNSDSLKESIIIKSAPSSAPEYTYSVSSTGSMSLNSDGSVSIYEGTDVKFIIESPYMFDSNDNVSYDITVSLNRNSDNSYTLKYTPNYEWLTSFERVYPITVDPTVRVYKQNKYLISQVGTCSASESDLERYYYIQKDEENSTELYIKLSDDFLAGLGFNYIITGAEVSLGCMAIDNEDTLAVYEISQSWDATNTSVLSTVPAVLDFNVIHANNLMDRYVWDVTDLANKWSMNQKHNNGIAFKPYNDSSCNVKIFNETSLNYTSYRPWFEIDYAETNRFTDDDVESFDMGRAGTLYLNKYSGTYYIERSDLSLNGNVMPIEAGAIYNPWGYAVTAGLYTGAYWINSHFMKMFHCGTVAYNNAERDAFVLNDTGGERTYFYEVVATDSDYGVVPDGYTSSFAEEYNLYKAVIGDSDKCLWVKKDDESHSNFAEMKIETSDCILSIDSAQRVCAISSKNGEGTANISFKGPSSSTISAVTDGVGRTYNWVTGYDANGVPLADKLTVTASNNSLISVNTKNGEVNVGVDYDYTLTDSGVRLLTKIVYPDGEEVRYVYNSSNMLTKIINVDGSSLSITYQKGHVKKISCVGTNNNMSITIVYDSVHQRRFEYNGLDYDYKFVVLQQYDKDMKKTSSVDNDGNFSFTEYNADGDIVSYSTNEDNAVNLIHYGDFSSDSGWEQTPANRNTITDQMYTLADSDFENLEDGMCYVRGKINTNVRVYRTLPTLEANAEGEVYTLSGWARNDSYTSTGNYAHDYVHTNKNFAVAILDSDGEVIAKSDFSPYVRTAWQFTAVSFRVTQTLSNVKVAILLDNQVHFVLFDDLRLVKSTSSYCAGEDDDELPPIQRTKISRQP